MTKTRMLLFCLWASALCCVDVRAGAQQRKVENVWRPLACTQVGGLLGERVELWRKKRLWHVADSEYLLSGFEARPGTHAWQGEHVGKWLHAATLASEATDDERLGRRLHETVQRLVATQRADGYLGTYAEKRRFYTLPTDKRTWDVWVHRYNLYGLLTYERFHPDDRVVKACERMADLLIETYGPGKADLTQSGTRCGISSSTLLESMIMLYERTRAERFLEFAEHIVGCSERNPELRLMGAMLDKEDVAGPGDGKAYQLMANLLGYLLLYRNTGTEEYLKTVLNGWENIKDRHLLVTGGPWSRHMPYNGNRECFAGPNDFHPSETCVETCSTTTWIQLNVHLFELTGLAVYAAEAERALLSHLLAAQSPEGLDWSYFTNANQASRPYESRISCCASSGPRALEMFYRHLVGQVPEGVSLNHPVPCSVSLPQEFGNAKITITGDYPLDSKTRIRFESPSDRTFALDFRTPCGSRLKSVRLNGEDIDPGTTERGFHRITRQWRTGDTIAVEFDYLLKGHIQSGEEKLWVAFTYGPFALAQKIREGSPLVEPFAGVDVESIDPVALLERLPARQADGRGSLPRFRVQGTKVILIPYYSAGSKTTGSRTYFRL